MVTSQVRGTPNWLWELNGAGDPGAIWTDHRQSRERRGKPRDAGFASGTWTMQLTLPADLDEVAPEVDPLLITMGLADAQTRMDLKLREAVSLCRTRGRSWSVIGAALGTSKQAAWQRYGAEDID